MNYNKNSKMRFRLWQRRGFWAVVSSLVALCLAVSAVPSALAQAKVVDIAVVPAAKTVQVSDTFTLEIWVYPNGQQVDSVDADMTFDPTYLEVLSITGDPSGLDVELPGGFDNTNGTLTHSRGKWAPPFPSTTFRLCSIEFRAKAVTAGTPLAFTANTDATEPSVGLSVLRNTTDGMVIIPIPVGGVAYLADPAQILAPWVGRLSVIAGLILGAAVVFRKAHRVV